MLWLFLTITAYALFAVVTLGDKYFLAGGSLSDPKLYAFYVGVLGFLVVLGIPFFGMPILEPFSLTLALATGALFLFGQYFLYLGLHRFEATRIVPATGALVPIFTFLFGTLLFADEILTLAQLAAFVLLIGGSALMTWRRTYHVFGASALIAAATSLFFGSSFAFSKLVYDAASFWPAFFWIRAGGGVIALPLLLFPVVRREFRHNFRGHQAKKEKKNDWLFVLNQIGGGTAAVLQNFAIAIVPVAFLPFVTALQGVQYVFLFLFTLIISLKYPRAKVHELVSATTVRQKLAGIAIIAAGLALLAVRF